jgi:hypothetical protein
MKSPKQKLITSKLLRSRAHNLGTIEALDAKAAEAFAVKILGLTDDQAQRLFDRSVLPERGLPIPVPVVPEPRCELLVVPPDVDDPVPV